MIFITGDIVHKMIVPLFVLVFFNLGFGQDDDILNSMLEGEDYITNAFNYGLLINNQTTETTPKGAFEFRIQHRFGELDFKDFGNSVVQEFLGFDGSANIRFGFTFALSDRLQFGIGRTKIDKVYDFEAKYKLLRQKIKKVPVSIALYFNAGISSRDFPEVSPNEFFVDGVTPFEYTFAHRIAYNTQIIVSKKINEKFSAIFSPTIIYKNLVPLDNDNLLFGATIGGRYKTGVTSSIIFEYTTKFNNRVNDFKDPIALGYEIGTAGHAFQIFIVSSNQIIPQNLFYSSPLDYTKGKLVIGFNIKRTFRNGSN
ncbi:DUF5777 family beta-barrel protein [Psychroserpens luteolus]|uniref:DUF5777 family beta-barrel protein n=1 Tax=Psychroserpens luteolus TaxID=2855840 RepID=UPI001E4C0EB3|nr:DUF5777 family beta-barrel protein [Psychroserpens luteolus]MCD2259588.1 hypothetical protein [Psychroserpens luteolus]